MNADINNVHYNIIQNNLAYFYSDFKTLNKEYHELKKKFEEIETVNKEQKLIISDLKDQIRKLNTNSLLLKRHYKTKFELKTKSHLKHKRQLEESTDDSYAKQPIKRRRRIESINSKPTVLAAGLPAMPLMTVGNGTAVCDGKRANEAANLSDASIYDFSKKARPVVEGINNNWVPADGFVRPCDPIRTVLCKKKIDRFIIAQKNANIINRVSNKRSVKSRNLMMDAPTESDETQSDAASTVMM